MKINSFTCKNNIFFNQMCEDSIACLVFTENKFCNPTPPKKNCTKLLFFQRQVFLFWLIM